MRINKIKALCKRRNTVTLYKMPKGREYISDGVAIYPVDDKLKLTEDMIRIIFEVSPKAWSESWCYEEYVTPDEWDVSPEMLADIECEDEIELKRMDTQIVYCGTTLIRFETPDGRTVWAPAAQFTPMDNVERYALRVDSECRMVAAYNSILCCGVVYTVGHETAEMLHDELLGMIAEDYI